MKATKIAIYFLVVLLNACAAPYPKPLEQATSQISFRTELPSTAIYSPKTESCFSPSGTTHYRSIWGAHKVWKIGILTPSENPGKTPKKTGLDTVLGINYIKTIEAPADKEFRFFAEGITGYSYNTTHYCGLMTGFVPKAGATYDVVYLRAPRGCNAIIRENMGGEIKSLTETEITRYPQCR